MSFAQQRFWFLDHFGAGAAAHIPMAFRFQGRLDVGALERALVEIVRRHAILRTSFPVVDGVARPSVASEAGLSLARLDLSNFAENREVEALRVARAEAELAFDLARGPLVRATLVALGGDDHLLLWTAHHIVWDRGSTGILLRELSALYRALEAGRASPLAELEVQYADFAHWQTGLVREPRFAAELAFWRARLAGLEPLELPTDRPRPPIQGTASSVLDFPLPVDLARGLRALAHRNRTTLATLLCAAFQALLARTTGATDVVVGIPVSHRTLPVLEPMIGPFVNTLLVRADLAGNPAFVDELLPRVRASMLDAYEHQDVPFELLVAEHSARRDPSRHPLHQVMFSMLAERREVLELGGVRATPLARVAGEAESVDTASLRTPLDLELRMLEHGETLLGRMVFDVALFERERIRRLAHAFVCLLEGIRSRPGARLSELPVMDEPERARLVERAGRPGTVSGEDCVHEWIARRGAAHPGATALIEAAGGARMTYAELGSRVAELAETLAGQGLVPGDAVALLFERSFATVVGMLGVLEAGGVFVPLDHRHPPAVLRERLAAAGVKRVLTDTRLRHLVDECGVPVQGLDAHSAPRPRSADASSSRRAHVRGDDRELAALDPAYLLFTSGSTGRPKAVIGSHRGITNRIRWDERVAPFAPDEVACHKTSGVFVDSVVEVLGPLCAGIPLVLLPDALVQDPDVFLDALAEHGVTRLVLVPSHLASLLEVESELGSRVPRLSRWTLSGEPFPWPLARKLFAAAPGARVRNLYGSTEVAADATAHDVGSAEADASVALSPGATVPTVPFVPIGEPLDGVRVYVLDPWLEVVPVGVPGELYVGGAGVAAGYHGDAAETARRFVPDPVRRAPDAVVFRTGDRVRWRDEGTLEWLGRFDAQVKLRGVRIEPGAIEAALAEHPAVARAAVVVRADPPGEPRLVAHVVARGPAHGNVRAAELLDHLRARLPAEFLPAHVELTASLPLTSGGKIDRRALPRPSEAPPVGSTRPRDGLEELLAAIWTDVLGLDEIGVHDDFFDLGGHSLLAVRVATRVRDALGRELSVRDLFLRPTVAALAELVGDSRASVEPDGVPLAPRAGDDEDGTAPLSFAQERLWILDRMGAGSAYHLPLALRCLGALDPSALERALGELVRRHAVLRTGFALAGNGPVQRVAPPAPTPIPRSDLSSLEDAARERALQHLAAEEADAPFDLAAPGLYRARLVTLSEREHVLLLTFHHAVADAWSLGLVPDELARLHADSCEGRSSPLAEPRLQYGDFARWQRARLQGSALERDLAYWRAELAGLEPCELPADRPRPPRKSYQSARHDFELDRSLADALRALAREQRSTLAMVLLAGWQALLVRLADRDDVAVGMPVAGRPRAELEGLIGLFVNLLVLRVDASGDPRFVDFLARVKETALAAYAHQELPFEVLVRELHPERDPSRHPLVQTAFTLQNAPRPSARESSGLTFEPIDLATQRTALDLELRVLDRRGALPARLFYDPALFEPGTIARLAQRFERVLGALVRAPALRLSELELLDAEERRQLLADAAASATPYPRERSAFQLFEEAARRSPRRIAAAMVGGPADGDEIEYGVLDRRANALAHCLVQRGVRPEERVGIALGRSLDLLVALLGVHKAGAAYLPLDLDDPDARLAEKIRDAQPALVLTESALRARLPAGVRSMALDEEARELADGVARDVAPSSLAYVVHTSGSTGRPRGVEIEHRSLVNVLYALCREPGLGPDDVLLAVTPLSFDIAAFELFGPLVAGAKVVIATRAIAADPRELARTIEHSGATVCQATPATWRMLVDSGWRAPRALRVLCGGETLPGELARALAADPLVTAFNLYGPTETTIWSTLDRVTSERVTIGRPLANTRVYVLDRGGKLVPPGVPGELWIGGDGVARGYVGDPATTAWRFRADPFAGQNGARMYATGDRVRRLADGRLEHLGRLDHQVKLRGHRIEPGEIEGVLARFPGVLEALVVLEERAGETRLVGYVACGSNPSSASRAEPDEAEVLVFLREHLPRVMVPSRLVFLAALPRNPHGKVDRSALAALAVPRRATGECSDGDAPKIGLERALAALWSATLRIERVARHDRFLDLGGHSLLAVTLVERIRSELGVELRPLDLLFADLAQCAELCGASRLPRLQGGAAP